MANQKKVDIQVGFSVDKSGLSQMQSLFQQIANLAQEPANKLNTGLQQAAKTASTLDGILSRTFNTELGTLNVTKFNQELKNSGLTLKTIQADFNRIGTQGANAYNRLAQAVLGTNQQLKQSSKFLNDMFTTFKNTVRYGISSSIFNNMANSIQKAYDYSKQLDTSLNDIRIVTDKSAESMADFAKQANEAAKGMGASTLDYTNAALIYYQQGLSDAEVAARAETTIKAANVTGQRGEEVSEQLTAVWNGYKVTAEETELYVDKLAAVAATTAADLEELSVGMSKVASAANAMGVDFDDLNAQIATIVSVTRQAPESVGTALKTIYARLGDLKVDGVDEFGVSLGEVSEQMVQMGIQILDQNGNLRNMTDVIAEVAEKWNGWTEAQRQAAAVAMAGKRQYNNLIALFDNWDMYTEALNTSTEAMGTLQHQQDIYMESTAAKLKTLKAAWQGLYDDAINEDEINAGIEALTNLVEVFDNFIDSFGGGIKSIAGFGAIVSSIFNKQIADSINTVNQRVQVFKNNLELAQTANNIRMQGASLEGSAAIQANTEAQIQYSQKIYDARLGLNQEQANTLINLQKEIGQTQELLVLDENRINRFEQRSTLEQNDINFIKQYAGNLDEINWRYEGQEDLIKQQQNEASKLLQIWEKLDEEESFYVWDLKEAQEVKSQLNRLAQGLNEEEKQAWNTLSGQLKTEMDFATRQEDVLEVLRQIVDANKINLSNAQKQTQEARKLSGMYEQMYNNQNKNNSAKQQADDMLKAAQSASTLTQHITTVTSALGNMAMAWSSVQSLIETWNNEEINFGDKLTQTLMTLGMTLPIVISNFSKLNEVFGISNNLSILFSQNKAKEVALNTLVSTQQEIENKLLQKYASLKGISVTEISASMKSRIADAAAGQADAMATDLAANAQWRLNTALLSNPIGVAIAAMTAFIGVLTIFISKAKQAREEIIKNSETTITNNNARLEEIKTNKELIKNYDDLIKKYKDGQVTRTEVADGVEDLCDKYGIEQGRILALTGQYDQLTRAIQAKRREELKEKQELAKENISKTLEKVQAVASENSAFATSTKKVGFSYQDPLETASVYQAPSRMNEGNSQNQRAKKSFTISGDLSTEQGLLSYYNQLSKAAKENGDNEQLLKRINKELDLYKESVQEIISELNNLSEVSIEEGFLSKEKIFGKENLNYDTFSQEYDKLLNSVKSSLDESLEVGTITQEQYDDALKNAKNYLDNLIGEYDQASNLLIQKEIINANKVLQGIDFAKWSEEDKALLFSGIIEFDGLKNEEEIKRAVELAKNQVNTEDLTTVSSLRSKVSSTKKLTTKEIKEAAGEESTLAQDYELALSDFDNQSQLKQVETLNKITEDKININKQYVENIKEVGEEEKALLELRKKNWEEEAYQLEKKKNSPGLTDEEQLRYEELHELISQTKEDIENFNPFEKIDDINFDNIVNGLEGVVSIAGVLRDLAEDVGEGWTIAADNIQHFGENFPELLSNQENYNILQDGSLQLTQQGREALQGLVQERTNDLKLQSQSYALELQKQIDIQQATADYYTQQADALEAYLQGDIEAKDTQAKLEENLANYRNDLMKITGMNDEELNRTMQENLDLTNANAEGDTKDIYDYWCSVGQAAAAAALAYESKEFNPPPFKGGTNTGNGASVRSFEGKSADEAEYSVEQFSSDQIQELINNYREAAEKASNRAAELTGEKTSLEAQTQAAMHALDNIASGKAGKDSKSGGSSKDKNKELKKLEEEFDRYWEIHKALDLIDRDLKKLNKDQENLYGKELIRSLKQENQLLDNQAQLYEQLAAAQQAEAEELRGKLALSGVVFDASGAVVNYAEATAAALKAYNDAVQQYNAGLLDDAAFKIHEKAFEEFKKNLERYDTLFYQEMKETQEKLDDIRREILANNLKAWEVEIQLKLDFKQLRRDWNDFINEVTSDFQSVFKDLRVEMKNMLDDAKTYIGEEGTIETVISAVHDVTGEIDKMMGGGESDMFESVSQAQEKLKELNEQLLDAGKALHDLYEQAYENLLDGIDQVADKFSKVIDRFERLNEEIEFNGKLIELLYGDEAYGLMSKYYEGMKNNILAQTESLKQQADFWKQEFEQSGASMDDFENWSEEQQKYYDNWMEAQSALNDMVLEYIQVLKDDYLNTIKDILKTLEKNLTGSSLDDVNEEWERISANADKYYDSIEKSYQIQTLANKIDEGINETNNLKAQQKLIALKEKEVEYLREKEKLTEYDIKAAELRYELALREIALEDAQQNKTSMKLTRNEQGNWSYQYVADENDIATKRQELLDTYNQLYQLASDAYEANLEAMQELEQKYLEKIEEIANNTVLTDEERNTQLRIAREQFEQDINDLVKENELYRQDLANAGSGMLLEIYNQDETAYGAMTDSERAMVDALIEANIEDFSDLEDKVSQNYQNIGDKSKDMMAETRADWTSSAQDLTRLARDLDKYIQQAYNDIEKANNNYQKAVDECARIVERDFSEQGIAGAIQKAEQETNNLRDKTRELTEASHGYLNDLRSYVDMIADAWRSVQDQIMAAINLIDEYLRKVGEANAAAQQQAEAAAAAAQQAAQQYSNNNSGNNNNNNASSSNDSGYHYIYRVTGLTEKGDTINESYADLRSAQNADREYDAQNGEAAITRYLVDKNGKRVKYATGGYTGSWGDDSGRMAILHQKELVLNADDTKNFLSGINTIRSMVASNGSIENAVLKAAANMAYSLSNITPGTFAGGVNNSNSSTENVFNITAEFPNANNVDDIRQAILTLPNIASQYVNSNLR